MGVEIALVHDYFIQMGGAERVAAAMHDSFPSLLSIHLSSVAKTTRVGAGDLAVSPYDNEATPATDVENNINKLSIYKFKTSW
jgi:hypothetical protein